MATKTKTSKAEKYALDAGVGINWQPNANGWGLEQAPYLAVLLHPIHGMVIHGPFLDEDAAHKWIREEGAGEVFRYYGGEDMPHIQWHPVMLHVPTHPTEEGK